MRRRNKNTGHNKTYADVENKKSSASYFKRAENFNYLDPSRNGQKSPFLYFQKM